MGRIEKTVFISYRRTNFPWAYCIYQDLTHHGFDVFFDYQSIDSGNFEKVILENIRARAHFIVILSPSALERCNEPGDWLRREIETAMDEGRNIIPIMLESFDFGSPLVKKSLTGKLAALSSLSGMSLIAEYMEAGLEKLRDRYLNKALEDIHLYTLADNAKEITEAQKVAAREGSPVEQEELTAQEWFERGYVFQQDKNFNEAIRCYAKAIDLQPNAPEPYCNLGLILHENMKRYDEAEAAYRRAIEISKTSLLGVNPSHYAIAYNNLGYLLNDLNRFNDAEPALRKAIELDPLYFSAHNNLGVTLKGLKHYDKAEAAFRKAIEICEASSSKDNPSYADAYYNLGLLLHTLKRTNEAKAAYYKAIEINPLDAETYYNLGLLLHEDLNHIGEAEAAYRKAIEINPSYDKAYSNLGGLLDDLKRYNEAEAVYRKAIEINLSDADARCNLGLLLQALKRTDEAEAAYRKAIEINPSYYKAHYNLALLLRLNNRSNDALPLLKKNDRNQSRRFQSLSRICFDQQTTWQKRSKR